LPQAIDPGPEGLRVPLAENALSAQTLPGGAASVAVDASRPGPPALVWKGPIPPGDNELRVGFVLQHQGELKFRQEIAQPFEGLRVVMEKLPGVKLEHVKDPEDRKWQGRDLILAEVLVPSVGNVMEIDLSGLPADLLLLRYLAGALAVAIALCFTLIAIYGKAETDRAVEKRRQKLEQKRDALLADLVTAEQRESEGSKPAKARPREKLVADLEQIYRHLDELDGG
jgi:hypothetical protein